MNYINYIPYEKINGIVFIEELPIKILKNGAKIRVGLFICPKCTKEFTADIHGIKNGSTSSCRCHEENHGLRYHPLYRVWSHIKGRCYNSKDSRYSDYGGRGISMCDEWNNSFLQFYNFCTSNGWKKRLQIDRIDNNGNYEPNNCRFVTSAVNNRNTRSTKLTVDLVQEIRNTKLLIPEITQRELASAYNVDRTSISKVLLNKIWCD